MDYSPYVFKPILAKIQELSLEHLEALALAVLNFSILADLERCLQVKQEAKSQAEARMRN